jgi:hypothetical protein
MHIQCNIALQMPFCQQAGAHFNLEEIHYHTKVTKSDRKYKAYIIYLL